MFTSTPLLFPLSDPNFYRADEHFDDLHIIASIYWISLFYLDHTYVFALHCHVCLRISMLQFKINRLICPAIARPPPGVGAWLQMTDALFLSPLSTAYGALHLRTICFQLPQIIIDPKRKIWHFHTNPITISSIRPQLLQSWWALWRFTHNSKHLLD